MKYRNDAKCSVQDQDVSQDVESDVADKDQSKLDEESVVGHGRKVKRISSTKFIADGVLHRIKPAVIAMSQKENPAMELDEEVERLLLSGRAGSVSFLSNIAAHDDFFHQNICCFPLRL